MKKTRIILPVFLMCISLTACAPSTSSSEVSPTDGLQSEKQSIPSPDNSILVYQALGGILPEGFDAKGGYIASGVEADVSAVGASEPQNSYIVGPEGVLTWFGGKAAEGYPEIKNSIVLYPRDGSGPKVLGSTGASVVTNVDGEEYLISINGMESKATDALAKGSYESIYESYDSTGKLIASAEYYFFSAGSLGGYRDSRAWNDYSTVGGNFNSSHDGLTESGSFDPISGEIIKSNIIKVGNAEYPHDQLVAESRYIIDGSYLISSKYDEGTSVTSVSVTRPNLDGKEDTVVKMDCAGPNSDDLFQMSPNKKYASNKAVVLDFEAGKGFCLEYPNDSTKKGFTASSVSDNGVIFGHTGGKKAQMNIRDTSSAKPLDDNVKLPIGYSSDGTYGVFSFGTGDGLVMVPVSK